MKVMSENGNKLGRAGWVALILLFGFLAWAIWIAIQVWTSLEGVEMSGFGWLFLFLGAFFSILVGGGLMGLVFYSNRKNYDR